MLCWCFVRLVWTRFTKFFGYTLQISQPTGMQTNAQWKFHTYRTRDLQYIGKFIRDISSQEYSYIFQDIPIFIYISLQIIRNVALLYVVCVAVVDPQSYTLVHTPHTDILDHIFNWKKRWGGISKSALCQYGLRGSYNIYWIISYNNGILD